MRVGDGIGCRGDHLTQRAIIAIKGGKYRLSHYATLIRDARNEGTGRVSVIEAINEGMRPNYLSETYEAAHGLLFWMPMECTKDQQSEIMEMAACMIETPVKYDWTATLTAPFRAFGIKLDIRKFNCSEAGWHMHTASGRLAPVYDKKGNPLAPVPGDYPVWARRQLYQLNMKA